MSPRLQIIVGVVLACLLAWLAVFAFAPKRMPAFLVPPGVHIRDDNGQPPIIVSDGSVQLLTGGIWRLVGNHYQSYRPGAIPGDFLEVWAISGATASPTCSVPGLEFSTTDLELDAVSESGSTDVYDIKLDGQSGMAQLDLGNGKVQSNSPPNLLEVGDQTWALAGLKAKTVTNQPIDCEFSYRPWLQPASQSPAPSVTVMPK